MVWRRFAIRFPLILCLLFSTCVFAKKKPPTQPVNINTANSEQLQTVPGIGPATAEKILQMRKSYGAVKSVHDLPAIRGLGTKRLEKMRKYIVSVDTTFEIPASSPVWLREAQHPRACANEPC